MHCVFVMERNVFDAEEEQAASGGADNRVDVALGEIIGLLAVLLLVLAAAAVADVGKERLIIEFPRGYGCVRNFIVASTVAVVSLPAAAAAVPNDSSGSIVPSLVVGEDQPEASSV